MNLNLRIGLYCLLGGLYFTVAALGAGHFWLWWLCGILTVASLTPVVRFGSRHWLAQAGTIYLALVVVGLVCTLTEAVLFFPNMKAEAQRDLIGGAVSYLIATVVLVALARMLKLAEPAEQAAPHRPAGIAIPMVVLAGCSYALYYQVFGYITYHYFTQQYYQQSVATQIVPLGYWFYVYLCVRGVVMVLAVLPIIYTLRLPRWQAALAVGVVIWIVGGGAALLVPNPMMVTVQRYEHIIEIMTQNVSLGVTAVFLLRPRAAKTAAISA